MLHAGIYLARRHAHSGERFFATTTLALTQMSQGGIYDHIGGGYARYSVDDRWLVPHFEKMLYDNAQIFRSACARLCTQQKSAVPRTRD